jgi:cysteine desulfurase
MDGAVLESMLPYFQHQYANPASQTHLSGRSAARSVESARKLVADLLGADPEEIYFTSGATESINIALRGYTGRHKTKGDHIITWATEHSAVIETLQSLAADGTEVSTLPVRRDGTPDISALEGVINDRTILIVCMAANNETGVISPLSEISHIADRYKIPVFSDATQAIGKIPFRFRTNGIDMASFSAHKFHGPKGVGGLYVSRRSPRINLDPITFGGGHEKGLRPGTLNVPGIMGMAKALEISESTMWETMSGMSARRTKLEQGIESLGDVHINGSVKDRLPNTTNLMIRGVKSERLITALPQLDFAVGSACTSAIQKPSHVLKSMGLNDQECESSIRLSIGRSTTDHEIETTVSLFKNAITEIRNSTSTY